MEAVFYIVLPFLGLFGGFIAGLLGIGGGIIMFPALLYVPQLLGMTPLALPLITGLVAMQTTFGTASSAFFHQKFGTVNYKLIFSVGVAIAISAFFGSITTKYISEVYILYTYGIFLVVSFVLLLTAKEPSTSHQQQLAEFSKMKSVCIGLLVGFPAGILGIPGSSITIPLLNRLLSIPIKVCISSVASISFIASLAALAGKISTAQVELYSALIIAVSAMFGAYLGAKVSVKVSGKTLKRILLLILFVFIVRLVVDIVG